MRRVKLLLLLLFFSVLKVHAKSILDSVFYINGKVETVNVTKNTHTEIEYMYEGEIVVNVRPKEQIYKIKYRSGRVEMINESSIQNTIQEPQYVGDVCILTNGNELVPLETRVMGSRNTINFWADKIREEIYVTGERSSTRTKAGMIKLVVKAYDINSNPFNAITIIKFTSKNNNRFFVSAVNYYPYLVFSKR